MPLDKQCYIYSIGTDSFYDEEESYIHDRMTKLYKLLWRSKQNKKNKTQKYKEKIQDLPDWKKKSVNRVLGKEKEKLISVLQQKSGTDIVRQLKSKDLIDKNIISLFESDLTRSCMITTGELSTKLFQVEFYFYQVMENLIKNGFDYNGKHYVYFSSSAGSIRKHRGLFIEENLYSQIKLTLTCGLTLDRINELGGCVVNKWLAYLALSSSATEIWKDFDIDKSIVCDDYEIQVFGDMDYIDASDYSVTRKYTSVGIPMNDGVGMMIDGPTRVIRGPFIKGLMVQFDFHKFLKEKCSKEQWVVSDIYGTQHNVIEEDIRYILTKSQFKMAKYFTNWDEYKQNFKRQCKAKVQLNSSRSFL